MYSRKKWLKSAYWHVIRLTGESEVKLSVARNEDEISVFQDKSIDLHNACHVSLKRCRNAGRFCWRVQLDSSDRITFIITDRELSESSEWIAKEVVKMAAGIDKPKPAIDGLFLFSRHFVSLGATKEIIERTVIGITL